MDETRHLVTVCTVETEIQTVTRRYDGHFLSNDYHRTKSFSPRQNKSLIRIVTIIFLVVQVHRRLS